MPRLVDLLKRIEALERPHAAKIELYWPGDGREPHPSDCMLLTWDDEDAPVTVFLPHNGRDEPDASAIS